MNGAFRRTPAARRARGGRPASTTGPSSFLVFEPAGLGTADAAAAAAAAAGDALPPGLLVDVTADQFDARLPRLWLLLPSDASATPGRPRAPTPRRTCVSACARCLRATRPTITTAGCRCSVSARGEKGRRAKAARDAVLPDLLAAGAAARDFARAQGGDVCVRRLWPWPAPASVAREENQFY